MTYYRPSDLDSDGRIKPGRFGEGTFPKDHWKRYKSDPIYQTVAKQIGIKNFNSNNDVRAVAEYIANGGGGGGGGGNAQRPPNAADAANVTRDSGKYDDIIDSLGAEVAAANARAKEYQDKAAQDISVLNANVATLDTNYANTLADLTLGFNNQIGRMNADFNSRYSGLQDLMVQQGIAHQEAQNLMRRQVETAENAYNEQVRIGDNIARSYVPTGEASAASAAMGDERQSNQQQTQRRTQDNTLSSLSILSGLGTNANPLAGMQLA